MRKLVALAVIGTVAAGGAAGVAAPGDQQAMTTAGPAEALRLDDVWVDAERVFYKVDVNADGVIDVDEYAAQAVVYASLARFNGLVAVDGRETVHVALPNGTQRELGLAEQTAIDAVARRDYYEMTAETGPLTARDWVALRLGAFSAADRNEDGQLTGRELRTYALGFARTDVTA